MITKYVKLSFCFALLGFATSHTPAQSTACKPFDFKLAPRFQAWTNSSSMVIGDINGDSREDVVTANSTDRTVSVLLGMGAGAFGPTQNFAVQVDADVVAVGDLNGDARPDLAVGSNANVAQISILLNNGNAGFGAATQFTIPAGAQQVYDLEIADLNGDGSRDLAAVSANNVVIFLGNGQGGFTIASTIPWTGRFAVLAAGDLNNDAISDLVVTRADVTFNWVFATILGNSAGTFSLANSFPVAAQPNGIQIGLLNSDAFPDIAITANYDQQPSITDPYFVQVWTGTGGANFTAGSRIGLPWRTNGVAIADFDQDNKQDLAVNLSSFVAKLNGVGDGTFAAPGMWMSNGSASVATLDTNSDNRKDIVALRKGSPGTLSVLITRPDGTPDGPRPIIGGGTHIVAADLNADGFKDLITTTASGQAGGPPSSILIAANDQNGGFLSDVSVSTIANLMSFELANINNDANPDLFTTHSNPNNVEGYLGNGAGSVVRLVNAPMAYFNRIDRVVAGYFNGDANQDAMIISADQGYIFLGNGNGTYQNLNHSIGVINPYVQPQVGDFNEDGKNDLAVVAPQQDGLRIYFGTGDGHFNLGTTTPISGFESMIKGDFNSDGNVDIAGLGGAGGASALYKFFGDGNGGFSGSATLGGIGGRSEWITAGDFDADGTDDLAFISYGTAGSLIVVPSRTTSPYSGAPRAFPVGGLAHFNFEDNAAIVAADYNNDGKIDIGFTEKGVDRGVLFNSTDPNTPCMSIDDVTVAEGDGNANMVFTVSLSQTSSNPVSFNYAVRDMTTTTGQDIENRYGRAQIPAGQLTTTISIPVTNDLLDEFDEQYRISLSDVTNAFLVKDFGLGTIIDNDDQPTITINDVELTEVATSQQAIFTLTLSAPSGKPIEVRYTTANGTATAGSDYANTSIVKSIPPGTASTTFGIQIFTDTMYEPTEDFFVNLTQPLNVTIADAQGKTTIFDDDPVPTFTISSGNVVEPDTGFVNRSVTIRLTNSTYLPVSGTLQTNDGTATAGLDYTTFSAPFTFSPGTTQIVSQIRVLGDTLPEADETFFVNASGVTNANIGTTQAQVTILDNDRPPRRAAFDFDGDGQTDVGITRPLPAMEWWINRSSNAQTLALQFGSSTDKVAPADYTGDGKADVTFWRPSTGEWYVLRSEDNSFFSFPFGANGDVPAPADFDGDGKGDFAVFRPSTATWFIRRSTDGQVQFVGFGANGDAPIPADFDGDGKADVAIVRNNAGITEWWIQRSTNGSVLAMQFGSATDKAVPGDYTGDGRTDVAFWRPLTGEWYIVRSEDFSYFAFPFGANGDIPSLGDYDGDGKTDPTVFRPSNATWFIARSTAGTQIVQFGANGDRPVPSAFVP